VAVDVDEAAHRLHLADCRPGKPPRAQVCAHATPGYGPGDERDPGGLRRR
jgi:hypothetical protein